MCQIPRDRQRIHPEVMSVTAYLAFNLVTGCLLLLGKLQIRRAGADQHRSATEQPAPSVPRCGGQTIRQTRLVLSEEYAAARASRDHQLRALGFPIPAASQ